MPGRTAVGLVTLLVAGVLATGCTMEVGRYVPNSQFAYPNSNVEVLGPVSGKVSRTSVLFSPSLSLEDIKGAYNEALSQAEGANILLNYTEDTAYTNWVIPVYTVEYRIEGQAARMEVGRQELE